MSGDQLGTYVRDAVDNVPGRSRLDVMAALPTFTSRKVDATLGRLVADGTIATVHDGRSPRYWPAGHPALDGAGVRPAAGALVATVAERAPLAMFGEQPPDVLHLPTDAPLGDEGDWQPIACGRGVTYPPPERVVPVEQVCPACLAAWPTPPVFTIPAPTLGADPSPTATPEEDQ